MKCRDSLLALALAITAAAPLCAAALDAGLTARGSFTTSSAHAGDTVEYRLRVEWRDLPAALIVLPPDELRARGLTVIGQSAAHRKTASAGAIRNVSEFSWLLVAEEPGNGRIDPFLLRYHSGLSDRPDDRIETISVEGASIGIGPARHVWTTRELIVILLGGTAFLACGLFWIRSRAAVKRGRAAGTSASANAPGTAPKDAFTRGVEELRDRCDSADSRRWLTDAETLCVAYLCRSLGVSKVGDVRFEAALDRYLSRPHAPEIVHSWNALRDLFHEARYAGGRQPPYALREACRHLKTCLNPQAGRNEPTSAILEKR